MLSPGMALGFSAVALPQLAIETTIEPFDEDRSSWFGTYTYFISEDSLGYFKTGTRLRLNFSAKLDIGIKKITVSDFNSIKLIRKFKLLCLVY